MKKTKFWAMFALLFMAFMPFFTSCSDDEVTDDGGEVETPKTVIKFEKTEITATAEEANLQMKYTLENAGKGFKVEASTSSDWITSVDAKTADVVKFTVTENTTTEERNGKVTLVYTCGEDKVEASFAVKQAANENIPQEEPDFKLDIFETGSTWAKITLDAKDDNMYYNLAYIDAETMEGYTSDEAFINDEMAQFQQLAEMYGLPIEVVFEELTMKGDMLDKGENAVAFALLDPEAKYYAYCYGFDAEWNVVTPVTKVAFEAKPLGNENLTVDFEVVEATSRTAKVKVNASSFDSYVCVYAPKNAYDEIAKDMDAFKEDLATNKYQVYAGSQVLNLSGLTPSTEYVMIAMGRASDTSTSEVFVSDVFTTKESVQANVTFEFDYKHSDAVEFENAMHIFNQDMTGYAVLYPKVTTNGVDYRFGIFNDKILQLPEADIVSMLVTEGYGKKTEGTIFALPYNEVSYVYGFGIDEAGNFGALQKLEPITVSKENNVTLQEMLDYIGISQESSRSGIYVAPWLKGVKGMELKDAKYIIKGVEENSLKSFLKVVTLR